MAAVAVGVLVIVGSAFVLGMNSGKGMARQAKPAVAANALDAFDTAHENLPTPPEPKSWEYENLGGNRAPEATTAAAPAGAATVTTAQARIPPPARQLAPADAAPAAAEPAEVQAPASAPVAKAPPPAPAPPPPAAKAAAPATAAKLSAIDRAIAAVGGKPVKAPPASVAVAPSAAAGPFVIQIGASSSKVEAERIAKRYASRGARVSAADVDGKRWYRVRLASYDSRPEAERALSRLSRETGLSGFVTAAR
jgi:cell division protein FtsN